MNLIAQAFVEDLAFMLHQAGREAVLLGQTVAHDMKGESSRKFIEWDELTEPAREGRRVQARFLFSHYIITKISKLEHRTAS